MLTDLVIVGWPLALANRKPSKMHSNPQKTEWNSLQPATTLRLTESVWKKKKKLGKLVNVQCGHAELIFGYFHPFGRKTEKVFGTAEEKKRNSTFPLIGTFFSVVSFHSLSLSLSLFFHLIFPPPAVGPPLCVRWPFFFFLDCHFYRRFQQQKIRFFFSRVCVCVCQCVCVCVCVPSIGHYSCSRFLRCACFFFYFFSLFLAFYFPAIENTSRAASRCAPGRYLPMAGDNKKNARQKPNGGKKGGKPERKNPVDNPVGTTRSVAGRVAEKTRSQKKKRFGTRNFGQIKITEIQFNYWRAPSRSWLKKNQ